MCTSKYLLMFTGSHGNIPNVDVFDIGDRKGGSPVSSVQSFTFRTRGNSLLYEHLVEPFSPFFGKNHGGIGDQLILNLTPTKKNAK